MLFPSRIASLLSTLKSVFTRRRDGHLIVSRAGQSSGPDNSNARTAPSHAPDHEAPLHPTAGVVSSQSWTSAELAAPSALAITVQGTDDCAHGSNGARDFSSSRGFFALMAALKVTREFAGSFPPLRYAATALLIVMEGFEKVTCVQEEFEYLANKLNLMQTTCNEHRLQLEVSESTKASMESLARAMHIVENMVQAKSDRGLFRRIWENPSDVKAVADGIRMLGDVVNHFIMGVTIATHALLFEGLQEQVLDRLAFADSAQFLSVENGRPCSEGTRAEFLADLLAWAMADDKPSICWVNGAAGSGKTAIAYTLCAFLRDLGLLGGSFFCSRDADDKRRSMRFIFSTLARSLAYHDSAYAHSLAEVLKEPGAGSVNASKQLTDLIAAPIRSAHSSGSSSSAPIRVLVIDALDECGDDPAAVNDLIRRLIAEARGLRLKFLVTSRPEPRITQAFETADQDAYLVRRVQDIPDGAAKADIRTYLQIELQNFAWNHHLPDNWPSETQIRALSEQAGTLFICASTACKYICQFADDPVVRLDDLIEVRAQPWQNIDSMYEFVLDQAKRSKIDRTWNTTRRCLQAIVCLSHPLCLRDLGNLLDIDHREVRIALSGLQSVLNIPSSDDSDGITIFHASFPDYLLDSGRSRDRDWSVESAVGHRDLLRRCIRSMTSNLCFNISNSGTSYASNDKQPVKPALSEALRYSCLYWIDHLEGCRSLAVPDLAELSKLVMERFLYWLEVMSMLRKVRRASTVMTRLLNWLHTHTSVADVPSAHSHMSDCITVPTTTLDNLVHFARDARQFATRFAQPIAKSCPHIYLSALAATTSASMMRTKMSPMFKGLPKILTGQTQHICPIFVLHGHGSTIYSVAFSPNGRRVVSGSDDRTIRLWDVATGAAIGDPLRGHDGIILSVAYSPDGMHIVSGSDDCTIWIWDLATGVAVSAPLRGHEHGVTSIAFSLDGSRVISGSRDCTIRLWDAATGAAVGEPLRGHESSINSVAFSPDGTRVVSGSNDHTIRLWDATTGVAIGDPLCGHEDWVTAVAFSPNGLRVTSGSRDCTIRLWDATTGATIGESLRGHESYINSVAFSLDGKRIVSGSNDGTIRLWDAATGVAIGGPLRGHENWVRCVAFSSDGSRVISGSDDRTIRLWDAAAGADIRDPLSSYEDCAISVAFSPDETRVVTGFKDRTTPLWDAATGADIHDPLFSHKDCVTSVAFSPNGSRIVSGSRDRTIRLWDAVSGAAIGNPLCGHEDWVRSVAFSPDGAHVISGASDCTIQMWDAATGATIGDPLRGHQDAIWSVAFSPDGTRVVSGSKDCTIRLWDTTTGAAIGHPYHGHEGGIWSVAFSPDGTRVVSGSHDRTIRRWDASTGVAIGEPLRGHRGWVRSVAFSPDGTRLVSGSNDHTVRLWDAFTGAAICDPLHGHELWITSVAFSPDGARIISGSRDCTIRLWDAATGTAIGDPRRGHEGGIWSVAFSPDGTRVASGSNDSTIRLWDVTTGITIGDSLPRHEGSISSIAFSPEEARVVSTYLDHSICHSDAETHVPCDHAIHNVHYPQGEITDRVDSGAPPIIRPVHACHPVKTSDHLHTIAFSRNDAHATGVDALVLPLFDRDLRDVLTLDDAGWLRGPNGELFLWIPPDYISGLWWPRTAAIIGTHLVMLDLSDFSHGEDWTKCFQYGERTDVGPVISV